jgi:hypothetical protein|tara:strand:+ start:208 stop:621 length:414 start_codon:yes stop_codon:yes gene_type:complete
MADEATLVVRLEDPIDFTVADGTAIAKGAVCKMTDGRVAILSDGDGDIVAGICARDKIASDGRTQAAMFRRGIFRGVAGVAGVTVGEAIQTDVSTSSANRLVDADVNSEQIIGIALETAASGTAFEFELGPRAVDLA